MSSDVHRCKVCCHWALDTAQVNLSLSLPLSVCPPPPTLSFLSVCLSPTPALSLRSLCVPPSLSFLCLSSRFCALRRSVQTPTLSFLTSTKRSFVDVCVCVCVSSRAIATTSRKFTKNVSPRHRLPSADRWPRIPALLHEEKKTADYSNDY